MLLELPQDFRLCNEFILIMGVDIMDEILSTPSWSGLNKTNPWFALPILWVLRVLECGPINTPHFQVLNIQRHILVLVRQECQLVGLFPSRLDSEKRELRLWRLRQITVCKCHKYLRRADLPRDRWTQELLLTLCSLDYTTTSGNIWPVMIYMWFWILLGCMCWSWALELIQANFNGIG